MADNKRTLNNPVTVSNMNPPLPRIIASPANRLLAGFRALFTRYPILVTALYLAIAGNLAFWNRLPDLISGSLMSRIEFTVAFFILIILFTVFLLQSFHLKYLTRPLLIIVLIASAFASYFMLNYGIVIDTTMAHNILETDAHESGELLTSSLFIHVFLLGIIPAVLVYKMPIAYSGPFRQVINNTLIVLLSLGLIAGNFLLFSSEYTSFFKNHHHARYLINPINYIYSFGKVWITELQHHDTKPVAIGLDAHKEAVAANPERKSLIVVVVGETARAGNFSLNGYSRNTNPALKNEDIINFSNFYSCGTSTHVSLPCMFSVFDRKNFDEGRAKYYEKLPDVLQHAGLNVLWRDNNSGCKGVCKNVPTEYIADIGVEDLCHGSECFDEAMLEGLKQSIEKADRDTVIFLHQTGSHGPAYYKRYPEQFQVFTPECRTNDLSSCPREDIVNAYDNTILYTDYFLGKVISLLKKESGTFNTAMLYASDHGESLGEHNVYLHSLPYMIAPDEQKHVPFIAWFSDEFLKENRLEKSCIKKEAANHYSHDNLFHTMLGLTHVSTSIYKPELDIFRPCHTEMAENPVPSSAS